ncbi:Glycoside hydrolase family 17 protein [Pyrenophora teres f. teres]|uniref:glucan endo-1,3-beta-D-glucosidase n=1 Tax=Pyrenophora teres f. teres TaxID=97479 RepID=A0A6S6VSI9_9PLEO|nr:Glycoside hydrolase family 17 protein [Pyrenophora teres f. teres]
MAYQQPHAWPLAASSSDDHPPPPPIHRTPVAMNQYPDPNNYSDYSPPGFTPGADNMADSAAGGGINGIAHTGPGAHQRESEIQAVRGMGHPMGVPDRSAQSSPFHNSQPMYSSPTYGSGAPLAGVYSSDSSMMSMPHTPHAGVPYADTPYNRYSSSAQNLAPQMGHINPNEVDNDDDWGMGPEHDAPREKRRSFAPFGGSRDGSSRNASPGSSINNGAVGLAGAAAGAGAYAATRDGNKYNTVPLVNGSGELLPEKIASWKAEDDMKKRKRRVWIAIVIIILILAGAILGGVLGATLGKGGGKDGNANKAQQAADDISKDNKEDLGKDSPEIKALMSTAGLHKVFPGMDYTPLNTQYPDCLHVGPSQNNITRDLAIMSKLTDSVRLYGTDCNQTQMLIHSIDRLEIKDSMKIWLGVWLDSNDTTTQRQIRQTWQILDDYGCDYFKGIIIGNEVLYRKDLTVTELLGHITDFRKNITAHRCQLPVAMADLGDNWTADMASKVDIVMSNVHPFFAGVQAKDAAAWTWDFWSSKDVALTASQSGIHQIIAEVGWPSGGGTDCGGATKCTVGSTAGIDEMNQFMEDWICPSMKNGTEYFWFSAFDEPWKIKYNTPGKNWEDKWGLMDINRNLKPGLKIPDCGGQSLPTKYSH